MGTPNESANPPEQDDDEKVIEITVSVSGFTEEELEELKQTFYDAGVNPDIIEQL
jgi:hypothetical protein